MTVSLYSGSASFTSIKYQALVENKALKALGDIIQRDYSGVSGLMMERYFKKKFQEEGRYIIGKWWDRKGENEIDLIVVDPIQKEVWMYELKKQGYRYKENEFPFFRFLLAVTSTKIREKFTTKKIRELLCCNSLIFKALQDGLEPTTP